MSSARCSGWSSGPRSDSTTVATIALSVALAFLFGYALTMRGVLRTGVPFRAAVRVALAADTVSAMH